MRFRKGLDKVSIFGAKECIRMQDFVLNIQKNSGGRDPRTPSAGGETFVRTYPRARRQMMVPLRFFWAGYKPGYGVYSNLAASGEPPCFT